MPIFGRMRQAALKAASGQKHTHAGPVIEVLPKMTRSKGSQNWHFSKCREQEQLTPFIVLHLRSMLSGQEDYCVVVNEGIASNIYTFPILRPTQPLAILVKNP
uniref:Uncharacterized protein n=1 Tax=Micrurus lemniscatus lemniscatus TaxID=129467 RepID=A0A2D4JLI3_MICLE